MSSNGVSSYLWAAYDSAAGYVTTTSAVVANKVRNIRREDVANAAKNAADAAASMLQSVVNACWKPPVAAELEGDGAVGERQPEEGEGEWVDLGEPGAPGGPGAKRPAVPKNKKED